MSSVRRFLFEESFDDDDPSAPRRSRPKVEEPPPPPPPPTFNQEELARARAEAAAEADAAGHARGLAEGRAEVEARLERQQAEALGRLADQAGDLIAARLEQNQALTQLPVQLALAILAKVLPEMARRHGLGEIEAMIAACLVGVSEEPRLLVRVHPELVEPVRQLVETQAERRGYPGVIQVQGEADYGLADARLEWANGGAERSVDALLEEVGRAAERLCGAGAAAEA